MGHSKMAIPRSYSALEHNGGSSQGRVCSRKGSQSETPISSGMQKWSTEALRAVETHLSLLEQGARRKLASSANNSCLEGKEDPNGFDVPIEGAAAQSNGSGLEDAESELGPLVELNSQTPLPNGWEQFLDLRTGQVYYIDWNSFKRSNVDPRKVMQLARDKTSSLVTQARAGWEFHSELTELENSECAADSRNSVAKMESGDEMEVESKWRSEPMHEEDWSLMRARGGLWPNREDRSEVSSEEILVPSGTQSCFTSCGTGDGAEEEEEGGVAVMGCKLCLSYFMHSKANPWCPNCGAAALV